MASASNLQPRPVSVQPGDRVLHRSRTGELRYVIVRRLEQGYGVIPRTFFGECLDEDPDAVTCWGELRDIVAIEPREWHGGGQ